MHVTEIEVINTNDESWFVTNINAYLKEGYTVLSTQILPIPDHLGGIKYIAIIGKMMINQQVIEMSMK